MNLKLKIEEAWFVITWIMKLAKDIS